MMRRNLHVGSILLAMMIAIGPVAVTQVQAGLGANVDAARSMRSFRRADPSLRYRYNSRSIERRTRKAVSSESTHEMRSRVLREAKLRLIESESIRRGLDRRAYRTNTRLERRRRSAEKRKSLIPRTGGILKDIRIGSATSTQRKAKRLSDITKKRINALVDTCKGASSRRRSACETIQRRKAERMYRR